jgi:hypothetical protein
VDEETRVLAAMDRTGQDVGIYRKFVVSRVDGSSQVGSKHERCAYFVLDWDEVRQRRKSFAHGLALQ